MSKSVAILEFSVIAQNPGRSHAQNSFTCMSMSKGVAPASATVALTS